MVIRERIRACRSVVPDTSSSAREAQRPSEYWLRDAFASTTVSAVIFLVSPGLTLATVYIVNLAEAGTYGMAIAASSMPARKR